MFIKWITKRDEFLHCSSQSNAHSFTNFFIPIEFHNEKLITREQLSNPFEGVSFIDRNFIQSIDNNSIQDRKLLDDDEFMLTSVFMNGKTLSYGSKRIRQNYMICKIALENNLTDYGCVLNKDALKLYQKERLEFQHFDGKSEDECVEIIKESLRKEMIIQFNWLPDHVLSSKKCVLLFLTKFDCLQHFKKELRDDIDVVRAYCKISRSLQSGSERIRSNKQIVMSLLDQMVSCHPDGCNFLKYCSEDLRNDTELVRKAVKICSLQICYASAELQSDTDLLLEVLEQTKSEYSSNEWNYFVFYNTLASRQSVVFKDSKLLMKALEGSNFAYEFASEELRNDPQIIEMASKHSNRNFFEYIPKNNSWKNDKENINKMIEKNGLFINNFSLWVRSNHEFCMKAIKQNGLALKYVNSPTMEMRIEAVKQNGFAPIGCVNYQNLYQIRMECEYDQLYLPNHLVFSKEQPLKYLSMPRYSHSTSYSDDDWNSTFDFLL